MLWQSQGAELCKSHQIWNTTLFLVVLILNKRSSNVKKILIVNSCLRVAINLRMGTLLCILHSICWTLYNKLVHLWKELKLEEVFPYIVWEKDKSISLCGIEYGMLERNLCMTWHTGKGRIVRRVTCSRYKWTWIMNYGLHKKTYNWIPCWDGINCLWLENSWPYAWFLFFFYVKTKISMGDYTKQESSITVKE